MKFSDFIEAETYFRKKAPTQGKMKKSEFTFKDYIKFKEELKKFEKMQKEEEDDKKAKQKKPDTWWSSMSVFQRAMWLTLAGPIVTLGYFTLMAQMIKQTAILLK